MFFNKFSLLVTLVHMLILQWNHQIYLNTYRNDI